eukprot:TRINITY_DN16726_c0_g1_i1.p1 TRINITY_DN16726_c0_g1~~TRINITY_DN16726_c0_g1_i1.p1  ORF type:complete len:365 (-),score=63.90 TRINITY_DN16726_c0_g1_i1:65-1159(-)
MVAGGRVAAVHAGMRHARDRGGGYHGRSSFGGASSSRQPPATAHRNNSEISGFGGKDVAVPAKERKGDSVHQLRSEAVVGTNSGLDVAVVPYLKGYGYKAVDPETWHPMLEDQEAGVLRNPQLSVVVAGHEEVLGHTWYVLACTLELPKTDSVVTACSQLDWKAERRLVQLREGLHDRVKALLGETQYGLIFADARFAPKGGLPGTSMRLNAWFAALTTAINTCRGPPSLTALTIQFLNIPELPEKRGGGGAAAAEGDINIEIAAAATDASPSGFSLLRNVTTVSGKAGGRGGASEGRGSGEPSRTYSNATIGSGLTADSRAGSSKDGSVAATNSTDVVEDAPAPRTHARSIDSDESSDSHLTF